VRVPADALRAFSARSQLVLIDAKPAVRKQILRELQIMHDCSSDHIVSFYGAFLADPHICICMEHMDRGCASVRWPLTPKRRLMLIVVPSPSSLSPGASTTSTASTGRSPSRSSARSRAASYRA
jgi:serine/threonine protein kinase